jgi:hypothetical protein
MEVPNYILDTYGESGTTLISEKYINSLVDSELLTRRDQIVEFLQDVAVDKYVNDPDNANTIKKLIEENRPPQNVLNLFKPFIKTQSKIKLNPRQKISPRSRQNIIRMSRSLYKTAAVSFDKNNWFSEMTSIAPDDMSFKDHLKNVYLVSFFRFTPSSKFGNRHVEMFEQQYTRKLPKNTTSKLKYFNYNRNIVFHYPDSNLTYVPIFRITKKKFPGGKDVIGIIVIAHEVSQFAILIRDEAGVVQEIGPASLKAENLKAAAHNFQSKNVSYIGYNDPYRSLM